MFRIPTLAIFAIGLMALPASAAPPAPRETLKSAKDVLNELNETPAKAIPKALLQNAEAIVVFPNTIKGGLVVGGRVGHGVAIVRDKDKGWGDVRFLDLGGASVGFQVGVQSTDVVLVFKNRKGLERILDGKAKLKLGADASVAAGPLGREAEIATDVLLKSEIFSYSRSRGLFAGVSLEGVVLEVNADTNASFEKDATEGTRQAAEELKSRISLLSLEKQPVEAVPALLGSKPGIIVPEPAPSGPVRRFFKRIRD